MQMAPPTAKNPRENAGLFSYFTFAWFLPTVVKAYKRPLNEDDLFRVLEDHRGESLGDDLEYQWSKEKLRKRPSLLKAIIRTIGPWSIISYSIGGNILDFIKIYQVVLLIKLLECLSHKSRIQIDDIYLYAGLLVGCSMFVATTQHLYTFGSKQMGMKVRLALCSLLYRKSLKLSLKAAGTTVGPLITMLSNDVNRFDLFAIALNHLVSPALQIPTILFIIYHFMGWTGCIGVGLILISIPLQGRMKAGRQFGHWYIGKFFPLEVDCCTSAVLISYSLIWEGLKFAALYSAEIALIRQANLIYSLIYAINHFTPEVPLLAAILTHIYLGNSIDAGYVYPLIMYYNLLKVTIMSYLGTAVLTFADIRVALKRFEKYLDSEEVEAPKMSNSLRERYSKASLPKALKENVGVTLTNATASWTGRENAIRNVSIRIPNEKLVAIVGPVGSGKSTLLNVILKELSLTDGSLEVVGAASYAAQEPCFFMGTIKDNILLGQMYDDTLYKKVVKICALEEDLSSFPSGDLTIVRDRGSNLSGGQRVRVNLARAMYRNADIYFLDEPLSGVDVSVAEHIFGQCIKDYLSDKCVLLVTNQLQFLQFVDYIYVLENGALVAEGTFDYLQKHRPQFLNLLQDTNEIGAKVTEYRASFEYAGRPMEVDEPEQIGDGYFNTNLLKIYAQGGGGFIVDLLVVLTLLIYYLALPTNNWFLSHWSHVDEKLSSQEQAGFSVKYSRNDHITFYISVVSILATAAVFYSMSCFLFFTQCNKTIHRKVFSKVIAAPMRFFYSNPSGTIINRFSRDLGIVDNYIIIAMMDVLDMIFIIGIFKSRSLQNVERRNTCRLELSKKKNLDKDQTQTSNDN